MTVWIVERCPLTGQRPLSPHPLPAPNPLSDPGRGYTGHPPLPPFKKTQTIPLPGVLHDGKRGSGNICIPDREGGLITPESEGEGGSLRFQTQQVGGVCCRPPYPKMGGTQYCTRKFRLGPAVLRRDTSSGSLRKNGKGGLFGPEGGRGLPQTSPHGWQGGLID